MLDKQNFRKWYMFSVALIGAVTCFAYHRCHFRYWFLVCCSTLYNLLVGSQITIKIPSARGQIAVSDTFIFLAILLFGVEAAFVLAAPKRFVRPYASAGKPLILFFNAE